MLFCSRKKNVVSLFSYAENRTLWRNPKF